MFFVNGFIQASNFIITANADFLAANGVRPSTDSDGFKDTHLRYKLRVVIMIIGSISVIRINHSKWPSRFSEIKQYSDFNSLGASNAYMR